MYLRIPLCNLGEHDKVSGYFIRCKCAISLHHSLLGLPLLFAIILCFSVAASWSWHVIMTFLLRIATVIIPHLMNCGSCVYVCVDYLHLLLNLCEWWYVCVCAPCMWAHIQWRWPNDFCIITGCAYRLLFYWCNAAFKENGCLFQSSPFLLLVAVFFLLCS